MEPLAGQRRHDRAGHGRRKRGEPRAADVAVGKRTRREELDEPRQPPDVRVPRATDDRLGEAVGGSVGAFEIALRENRGRGPLERNRRTEAAMPSSTAKSPPMAAATSSPATRRVVGNSAVIPTKVLRLVVASEEDRGRPERVVLVVLAYSARAAPRGPGRFRAAMASTSSLSARGSPLTMEYRALTPRRFEIDVVPSWPGRCARISPASESLGRMRKPSRTSYVPSES